MTRSAALLALIAAGTSGPALAGEASAVMRVGATVVESCSVAASPMHFELGSAAGSRAIAQAEVALECNGPAAYEIALDGGAQGDRKMVDPASGAALGYEIYSDASLTSRWGSNTGVDTVSGTAGTDGKARMVAYGEVASTVLRTAPGSYSDAVLVTVNF